MSRPTSSYQSKIETPTFSHLSAKDYDSIYEPAEDSFLFLDALENDLAFLRSLQPAVCLEMGSGSGVVVTALAGCLGAATSCLAVDINPAACLATRRTATENLVSVEALCMDLAACLKDGTVDLLLFNPPYVPTESAEVYENGLSRSWAGGVNGREVIDRLLIDVARLLSKRGVFYMVLLAENKPDQIETKMNEFGFEAKIVKERKIRGEHLFIARYNRKTGSYKTEDGPIVNASTEPHNC